MVMIACGGGDGARNGSPLSTDGAHLRDADGRVVILRGVNARIEGIFDVTFDDGRVALEDIPELTSDDCVRMRELGLNLLRLPINWSGIEPDRDVYDEVYLQRVDTAVQCAADAGVYVLIDLHQDAYSKEIGEDGAPLWAIVPPPEMLLEGPLTAEELQERRTSSQVTAAFDSFFDLDDAAGLQAEFIDMLRHVGARYADHPMVIGFEIFNEPQADADPLHAFDVAAAAALREVAPDKLVSFEPPVIRNFTDFSPLASAPFPVDGAIYAPHIYTFVFGNAEDRLANLTKAELRSSVDNARAEATAHGTPLLIGEWGIGPTTTNADLWIQYQNELHDEYLASNAFWLWKEESQGAWGVYERNGDEWVERPQVVGWVSRLHPERIAGDPVSVSYDGAAQTLRLESTDTGGLAHDIYIPERAADSFSVTCDDSPIIGERAAGTGLIAVACDGILEVIAQ
jgi:endoglycosylceramidase